MEKTETDLIVSHPYMRDVLLPTLNVHKELLECLEKRITLVAIEYDSKSEYEKNEIKISRIKTNDEITTLRRVIKHKEKYFQEFMEVFIKDLKILDEHYEKTLEKAKKKAETSEPMKQLFARVPWDTLDKNLEAKVELYKRMKRILG